MSEADVKACLPPDMLGTWNADIASNHLGLEGVEYFAGLLISERC